MAAWVPAKGAVGLKQGCWMLVNIHYTYDELPQCVYSIEAACSHKGVGF